jgi:23S rRNA pseudouridine2605 synthase
MSFKPERIAKVIARAGLASRREAERMIEAGRVTVDGTTISSPALNVTPDNTITLDGKDLPKPERARLWCFHKPKGLVNTHRDPEGRKTVFESLPPDLPRLISIGRLDINSEGLLLLTNDGGLARTLELPETGWTRRYRVRAHGRVTNEQLTAIEKGVTVDKIRYGPIQATLDKEQGANIWLSVSLQEGKNREVRRVMEHIGLTVNRLIRLAYGPFQLGKLKRGEVKEIPKKALAEQLGSKF